MSVQPLHTWRFPLHLAMFWFGIAASTLSILGLWMSWDSNRLLWLSRRTFAIAAAGKLELAYFSPGSVAANQDGLPTNFSGTPPLWSAVLPFWFLIVAFLSMTLLVWLWQHRPRTQSCPTCGLFRDCPVCGYSVASLPKSIALCPECGTSRRLPEVVAGDPGRSPDVARRFTRLGASFVDWYFSRICCWTGAFVSVAIIIVMFWCDDSSRLGWMSTHTYCIFHPGTAAFAIFQSPDTIFFDARGIPAGAWKPLIWSTSVPLWALLCSSLSLTLVAWLWGRSRWRGPCPHCDKPLASR